MLSRRAPGTPHRKEYKSEDVCLWISLPPTRSLPKHLYTHLLTVVWNKRKEKAKYHISFLFGTITFWPTRKLHCRILWWPKHLLLLPLWWLLCLWPIWVMHCQVHQKRLGILANPDRTSTYVLLSTLTTGITFATIRAADAKKVSAININIRY